MHGGDQKTNPSSTFVQKVFLEQIHKGHQIFMGKEKVKPYRFILGPLFWECPPPEGFTLHSRHHVISNNGVLNWKWLGILVPVGTVLTKCWLVWRIAWLSLLAFMKYSKFWGSNCKMKISYSCPMIFWSGCIIERSSSNNFTAACS